MPMFPHIYSPHTVEVHPFCNRHRNPWAASLPGRSQEMKLCTRHVNKVVNVCANVMYNKYEWYSMYCMHGKKQPCVCRGTFGGKRPWVKCEQLSLRILTTSSGRRGFLRGPQMGLETESVDAQKGTKLDIIARCHKTNIAQVCTLFDHVLIVQRNLNSLTTYYKHRWEINSLQSCNSYTANVCTNLLATQISSCLFPSSYNVSCNNRCFFSVG
jgi:hypothetical protein